jgi:hypothetical protein
MDRPTTLWEMMEQVADSIESQPLNYYQGVWARSASLQYGREACGTAYCRAGWMAAIGHDRAITDESAIALYAEQLLYRAGIPIDAINDLFSGIAIGRECRDLGQYREPQPGTPQYAKKGADGVRNFMREFEPALKAARLVPDGDTLRLANSVR